MLWNQDPYRNRWALIAKVYSFIRDEIGKDKIPLSQFLGVCCPLMKTISPSAYLSLLGWHVENKDEEGKHLVRDGSASNFDMAGIQSEDFPNTEYDLLVAIFDAGYLPAQAQKLMQRMAESSKTMMTAGPRNNAQHPIPFTDEKQGFLCSLQENPTKTERDLFGHHYDEIAMRESGPGLHSVEGLTQIDHFPLDPPTDPNYYPYPGIQPHPASGQEPVFDFGDVLEHECLDVGNPYDMDAILGFSQPAVERCKLRYSPLPNHAFSYTNIF